MKKGLTLATVATMATLGNIYKEAYVFGKEVVYRESFLGKGIDNLESIKIKNHKELILQGYLYNQNANQTLIVLHPFNESSYDMIPYIEYFKNILNANILLVDALAHGNSDGYIRGFGYKDVTDLMYWNAYVLQRFGSDHSIIMFGKEMGANTILNTASLNKLKNVKAIISEGAYDSVNHYLSYNFTKNEKTMSLVSPIIRQAILNEVKLDINKMNTVEMIKNNTIPTLFIHSQKDKKVYFNSGLNLYNKANCEKEFIAIKEKALYESSIEEDIKEFLELNTVA
jgi:hypothetical protein